MVLSLDEMRDIEEETHHFFHTDGFNNQGGVYTVSFAELQAFAQLMYDKGVNAGNQVRCF